MCRGPRPRPRPRRARPHARAHAAAPAPAPTPAPTPTQLALGARLDRAIGPAPWALLIAGPTSGRGLSDRRLMHDLRRACLDVERPLERGDVLRFVLSLGRRPLVQPLPHLGPVRVVRHLARARGRTTDPALGDALDAAITRHEEALRARLRPILRSALTPAVQVASIVEEVALTKTIEELLDRLITKGRLDFPTLRDGVSRNHAKLADLRARDVVSDPLLVADKLLADGIGGVHRRGEVYRRALHRASALAFGTPLGRIVTRFALIPVIGAYALIEALQHTVGLVVHLDLMHPIAFVATALFIGGLVNSAPVRKVTRAAIDAIGRGLRAVFVSLPRWLAARPFFKTVGWRLVARWLIEPALLAAPISIPILLFSDLPPPWLITLALAPYAAAIALINSALGLRLEEATTDAIVRIRRVITEDLLPGLIGWVLAVFRALLDGFERALYAVDERFRVRAGTRQRWVVLVAFLAMPWRVVSYIARLYMNLSLEPKVNPVKHFPAVTIGHKLIVPVSLSLAASLEPSLGATAANTIATVVLFVVPGFFGFLAWELKENWRLYDRNRPTTLRPVVVGSHGESVRRLLRPGFHSGTLPKLFAKLRRTIRHRPGPGASARSPTSPPGATTSSTTSGRSSNATCSRSGRAPSCTSFAKTTKRLPSPSRWPPSSSLQIGSGCASATARPSPSRSSPATSPDRSSRLRTATATRPPSSPSRACTVWRPSTSSANRSPRSIAGAPYAIDARGLVVWPGPGYANEVVRDLAPFATTSIAWSDWVAAWQQAMGSPSGLLPEATADQRGENRTLSASPR